MIPGVNIISRKSNVVSVRAAGGSGGSSELSVGGFRKMFWLERASRLA